MCDTKAKLSRAPTPAANFVDFRLIAEDKLAGIPTLIFANKQDLLQAQPPNEICDQLTLSNISGRTWNIQACSAKTGEG